MTRKQPGKAGYENRLRKQCLEGCFWEHLDNDCSTEEERLDKIVDEVEQARLFFALAGSVRAVAAKAVFPFPDNPG
jgi:hypothetical protein